LSAYSDELTELFGLKHGTQNNETTLVTTNYDLIPEIALKRLMAHITLPNKWDSLRSLQGRKLVWKWDFSITLCKLHGSVNWFHNPADKTKFLIADHQRDGQTMDHSDDDRAKIVSLLMPEACHENFVAPSAPLLVPPTFFKMQNDEKFDLIWQTAGRAIRNAEQLLFIGYSFPPSDIHMKYFLAYTLRVTQTIPKSGSLIQGLMRFCAKLADDKTFRRSLPQ